MPQLEFWTFYFIFEVLFCRLEKSCPLLVLDFKFLNCRLFNNKWKSLAVAVGSSSSHASSYRKVSFFLSLKIPSPDKEKKMYLGFNGISHMQCPICFLFKFIFWKHCHMIIRALPQFLSRYSVRIINCLIELNCCILEQLRWERINLPFVSL